jgi:hypothetical protein
MHLNKTIVPIDIVSKLQLMQMCAKKKKAGGGHCRPWDIYELPSNAEMLKLQNEREEPSNNMVRMTLT